MAFAINTTELNNVTVSNIVITELGLMMLTGYGPLLRVALPAMFTFALFGNMFLLVSVVARKLHKRSPVFIFLSFIAIFDCVSITTISSGDIMEIFWGYIPTDRWCNVTMYFYYAASKISVFTLIAVYIFKLRGLNKPLDLIAKSQTARTFTICFSISIVVLLADLYMPVLGTNTFIFGLNLYVKDQEASLHACSYSVKYPTHSFVRPLITMAAYAVIPGIFLTILSAAILLILHRNHKLQKQMTGSTSRNADDRQTNTKSAYSSAQTFASVLIAMSTLHIVTTIIRYADILRYISRVVSMQMSEAPISVRSVGGEYYQAIVRYFYISRFVSPLNFSLNVYLQVIVSKYFRHTLIPCFAKR